MVGTTDTAEVLTRADKSEISARVRLAKLALYERHIDHLLDCAMAATRDIARQTEKNDLLKSVNQAFTTASPLGMSEAVRDSVKARLVIIRETSAAGQSVKAKEAAEREALRREAVYPNEQRTFTRWRDPPLVVVIGERSFTTDNWSLGGMLIDEIDPEGYRTGDQIDVQVGLRRERLYKERFEIVRVDAEARRLAVKSRRFTSALMLIKRECDLAQCSPA
jgi:hypothetical protein